MTEGQQIEIPVLLNAGIDDIRVGTAKIVGLCECSPNHCCCGPQDQKPAMQFTIDSHGMAQIIAENAKNGLLTGLILSYQVRPAVRGNTSEQER